MRIKLFVCYLNYFINLFFPVYQLLETFVLSARLVLKKGNLFFRWKTDIHFLIMQSPIFFYKGWKLRNLMWVHIVLTPRCVCTLEELMLPFLEILDWSLFSLRVRPGVVPARLPAILQAVSPARQEFHAHWMEGSLYYVSVQSQSFSFEILSSLKRKHLCSGSWMVGGRGAEGT